MKVKIIDGIGSLSLENEINDFIKDKEIVDIKYQIISALIMYKED